MQKIRFECLKSEIAFIIEDAIRMLRIKREMRFQEMLIPPIPLYKKLQLHRIYKKIIREYQQMERQTKHTIEMMRFILYNGIESVSMYPMPQEQQMTFSYELDVFKKANSLWRWLRNRDNRRAVEKQFVETKRAYQSLMQEMDFLNERILQNGLNSVLKNTAGEALALVSKDLVVRYQKALSDEPLLCKAIDMLLYSNVHQVTETTTSFFQTHLKIGYAHAAQIMDIMEELGTIGAYNSFTHPHRKVQLALHEWEYIKGRMSNK